MTNLILTTIGVVLAAIAALIAFDYGGDYFLEGYNRAQATSLSNAGNNVSAAYSVFGVQRRRAPQNLGELVSSIQGKSLLKRIPEVQGLGTVRDQWVGLDRGKGVEAAFVIESVSPLVCRTLNERLNGAGEEDPIPGAPAFASGCFSYGNGTTVNVYYSFLGGASRGGSPAPYSPITDGWNGEVDETGGGGGYIGGGVTPTPATPAPTPTYEPGQCGEWLPRYSNDSTTAGQRVQGATLAALQQAARDYCQSMDYNVKSCELYQGGADWGVAYAYRDNLIYETSDANSAQRYSALCNGAALPAPRPTPTPTPTPTPEEVPGVESCSSGGLVASSVAVDPSGVAASVVPQTLCRGDFIQSPGNRFNLTMRSDGDLVLSMADGTQLWSTGTSGSDVQRLDVQSDGNAVLYNTSNQLRWSTGTNGHRGQMRLSSDGNLTVYNENGSSIVWQTRTDICLPAAKSGGSGSGTSGKPSTLVPARLCNNEYVVSPDQRFRLLMDSDGNLKLQTGEGWGEMIWQSGTSNSYVFNVQPDGNAVSYARSGSPTWATGTNGWSNARMMVEKDGNLTVWSSDGTRLLWESRTDRCLPTRVGDGQRTGDWESVGTIVPSNLCNNEFVESPNGRFRLSVLDSGNLTLFMRDAQGTYGNVVWNTGTSGAYKLLTEGSGNVQLINRGGGWIWRTGTWDQWGARMMLQNDGNVVVRNADNSRLLWESRSVYCTPAEKRKGTRAGDFGVMGTELYNRLCWNEYATSPNGRFRVTMRENGSLAVTLTGSPDQPLWESGASDAYALFGQGSGNWQTEARDTGWRFRTGSWDRPGAQMAIQDDGNLVVRSADNSQLYWETRSVYCLASEKAVGTRMGDFGFLGSMLPDRMCTNEYTTSPNGKFRVTMQPNGSLAVTTGPGFSRVIWETGPSEAYALFRQGSGNWQTEDRGGNWKFRTGSWDRPGARMMIQDDGNLVVRSADNNQLYWESRSVYCVPAEKRVGTVTGDFGVSGALVGPRMCANEYTTSPNGRFRLTLQENGSLQLATGEGYSNVVWETGASDAYALFQQGSGNWQTEARDTGWRWRTGTWDNGGARLIVQDDGNLVVRTADNSRQLWEARTTRCVAAERGNGTGVDNIGDLGTWVSPRLCTNEYVTSPNGRFRLTMRPDGNLAITMGENYSETIWESDTSPTDAYALFQGGDGNWQTIGRDGGWRWRTATWDNWGARLLLNDRGNLVVMNGSSLKWESRSDRCLPASVSGGDVTSPQGMAARRQPFFICQNEWVESPNGRFRFTLNANGNLQLLDGVNHDIVLWQSGTNDPSIYRLFEWGDGNHWMMDRNGSNRWQTGTWDNSGARLLVQDDGNVTIFNGTRLLWQTGTGGRTGDTPGSVADIATRLRAAGVKAVDGAKVIARLPRTLADVGMTDADVSFAGEFKYFYQAGDHLNFEVLLTGQNAEAVCTRIATLNGSTVADRSQEAIASEGCASFNTGFYYWRRVDDAQAGVQVQFVRAFGKAVYDGSGSATSQPGSLADVGMAGAERYNLLDRSGFEAAGENWQFFIKINSATACRAIDAAVGNPARTIDADNGFSYVLDEGCGGEGGSYFYWRNVNGAYDQAIASKVLSMGNGAAAAALSNGGEQTSEGRAAAAAFLSSAADGFGFITRTGVYQAGSHYTGEIRIASGAACRRIDVIAGNGDRGPSLPYASDTLEQGCGRYSDGTYWYWRRLDVGVAPGTVFDAKLMFSSDANDDPSGIWNYLEGNPQGGADVLMANKDGCSYGPCVRGAVDAVQVGSPTATAQVSTALIDASTLLMHPGPDRDVALRFRAPVAGWYRVQGTMRIGDTSPSGVLVDWGQGAFAMDRATSSYVFDYNRRMEAGETLSFRVDRAGAYNNDGMQVTARLTYAGVAEPAPPTQAASGHRFWRVLAFRSTSGQDLVSVGEIELRGSAGGADLTDGANGTAIASSVWGGGHEAYRAFNNDPNDRWASVSTNAANINQWIGYDFGEGRAVDVKQVAWKVRTDCCRDQTIGSGAVQWSDDGQSWSTAYNFMSEQTSPAYGQTILLDPLPAAQAGAHRYWRIRGDEANDPYMRASEIEMRETPGGPNVARFGIPFASSYFGGGYAPFYAFDGTTGGNAWATSGGLGWIGVDLLVPRAINEFRYASAEGPKAPTDFTLEWSDDKVNWTPAWRNQFADWGNTELKTFSRPPPGTPDPTPVMATSIVINADLRSACIEIAELEAYTRAGVNVAAASNGGVATGSPPYSGEAGVGRTNDGVRPAGYPAIFHSSCSGGDYLRITFAQAQPISRLMLYARTDYGRDRHLFSYKLYNGATVVGTGTLNATYADTVSRNVEAVQQGAQADWTKCTDEGGFCSFNGTTDVRYGAAGGPYLSKMSVSNGVLCANAEFGGDPAPGSGKICQYDAARLPDASSLVWTKCADEGSQCTVPGTAQVRYGASGRYRYMTVSGGIACSNAAFGGDPANGSGKSCEYASPSP